ncbi:uncharacterized protein [Clytia hemisphaerica]|uniref:Uncharacterized protein n=1 Tax=Clytia hemisphaerica TaxID=252671 RepID=A0A7M5WQZ7_9CNID|eukprot:TCONS_00049680-protein
MSRHCSTFVFGFIVVLLIISLVGMACSAATSFWFTQSYLNTHIGLWESCTDIACLDRKKHILRFEDHFFVSNSIKNKTFDLVMVLLMGSGLMSILSLVMCCIQHPLCRTLSVSILSFTSAGSSIAAIVLSEILIKRKLDKSNLYEHGWSAIVAWVGTGANMLAFLLCMFMCCCCSPKEGYDRRTSTPQENGGFHYTPNDQYRQAYSSMPQRSDSSGKGHGGMENAGYQLR